MTAKEIYERMKADFERETGQELNDNGDMAVRMYAAAAQIESLYAYNDWVMKQCFPQTAAGEYLERHGRMRGLRRNPAVKAEGIMRFMISAERATDVTVPAGTVCLTGDMVYFETVEPTVIAAGALQAQARAVAMEAGTIGNVAAGSIVYMSPAPVGVTGCVNPAAFSGGADEESDEALRERILESYKRLPNGANKAYYESEVLAVPGTAAVTVLPKRRGLGTVDVIFSTAEGVPSEEMVKAVKARLDATREICVDIDVSAPETREVDVELRLKAAEGTDFDAVSAEAEKALRATFDGRLLSRGLTHAVLGDILYHVEGVENYAILGPAEDIEAGEGVLPVLGELTIHGW